MGRHRYPYDPLEALHTRRAGKSMSELICYVYDGWTPRIRPALSRRRWMDDTPEQFAYRCLPLAIANSHGWELLSPCGFEARWNGGAGTDAVEIRVDDGAKPHQVPVSLFGHGTVTFHVEATKAPVRLAREIRGQGARASMALKPATPIEPYEDLLAELDMLLIMTVEPGVYVPGVGGVRIEDTVLVTSNGPEILTGVTKELVEVGTA